VLRFRPRVIPPVEALLDDVFKADLFCPALCSAGRWSRGGPTWPARQGLTLSFSLFTEGGEGTLSVPQEIIWSKRWWCGSRNSGMSTSAATESAVSGSGSVCWVLSSDVMWECEGVSPAGSLDWKGKRGQRRRGRVVCVDPVLNLQWCCKCRSLNPLRPYQCVTVGLRCNGATLWERMIRMGKVSYHIKTAESAYYSNMLFLPLAIPYLSSKEHFSQM